MFGSLLKPQLTSWWLLKLLFQWMTGNSLAVPARLAGQTEPLEQCPPLLHLPEHCRCCLWERSTPAAKKPSIGLIIGIHPCSRFRPWKPRCPTDQLMIGSCDWTQPTSGPYEAQARMATQQQKGNFSIAEFVSGGLCLRGPSGLH